MPLETDPGWKLETDEHGCSVWTNRNTSAKTCGGIQITDAGSDADAR